MLGRSITIPTVFRWGLSAPCFLRPLFLSRYPAGPPDVEALVKTEPLLRHLARQLIAEVAGFFSFLIFLLRYCICRVTAVVSVIIAAPPIYAGEPIHVFLVRGRNGKLGGKARDGKKPRCCQRG